MGEVTRPSSPSVPCSLLHFLSCRGGSSGIKGCLELRDVGLCEGQKLLRLDLVVVVLVDLTEHGINILVRDGQTDMVLLEETNEEFAKLAAVQPLVAIVVILTEVAGHLRLEGRGVLNEVVQFGVGGIKLTLLEIASVDLHICLQ